MCEREYSDGDERPNSKNGKSGVWYHARWKPHEGTCFREEPIYNRIRYEPVLLTADQAAKFAVGELKREDLPPRMKEVIVTDKQKPDILGVGVLGLLVDYF